MSAKALAIIAILSDPVISSAQHKLELKKTSPTTAASTAPHIYLVDTEPSSKQYSIHFETLPNKKYTVQATPVLPATNWIDVQVVPAFLFPNHWIYTEKYTNEVKRYFRIKMH